MNRIVNLPNKQNLGLKYPSEKKTRKRSLITRICNNSCPNFEKKRIELYRQPTGHSEWLGKIATGAAYVEKPAFFGRTL